MCKYKIVCLKEKFLEMVNSYPCLVNCLYTQPNDMFESKQMDLLFEPMQEGKQKLLKVLNDREDYTYYHGQHVLTNPITDEKVIICMNEYDIEVQEGKQNHAIFDLMQSFSQKFYMIKA